MTRADARLVWFLAVVVAVSAGAAPQPSPIGASALDALGVLREAEAKSYRLEDDGVHTIAMRVGSPAIDDLTSPGGRLAGRDLRIILWWQAGESRVKVDGAGDADPRMVSQLEALARPLPALLLPQRASRELVGYTFRVVPEGSIVRAGERGIEAVDRAGTAPVKRALFAISREGLVVGERLERKDGTTSEFRHHWLLQGGRYLLGGTEGWIVGRRVAAEITWGDIVGDRPVPTRVSVLQGDMVSPWPDSAQSIELTLSEHRINVDPPPGLFPKP